jgi:hypothetical protein
LGLSCVRKHQHGKQVRVYYENLRQSQLAPWSLRATALRNALPLCCLNRRSTTARISPKDCKGRNPQRLRLRCATAKGRDRTTSDPEQTNEVALIREPQQLCREIFERSCSSSLYPFSHFIRNRIGRIHNNKCRCCRVYGSILCCVNFPLPSTATPFSTTITNTSFFDVFYFYCCSSSATH